jgi:hypothetical protein
VPEWWGALGDGSTNDQSAINKALTHWLQRTVQGEFRFLSGKNYLINSAISKTISSTMAEGGWYINGYGSKITSGLTTGYLLSFKSQDTVRQLVIHGISIVGSGNEDGILKFDGGNVSSSEYLYNLSLRDINMESFGGTGVYVTNNVFETKFDTVNSYAASGNTTGYGFYFDEGAHGTASSIDMIACNTRYGKNGFFVESPIGDVTIYGGTFLLAQEYGVLLQNNMGTSVVNAHFENNWESARDLANGGAGLKIQNSGTVMGCFGTTNSKQKYVVELYVSANKTSAIIGGSGLGNTVAYAYVNGAAGSSVHFIGEQTVVNTGATVIVTRSGIDARDLSATSTSGTGEDDLKSHTIIANTLGVLGGLRLVAVGTKTGTAGNKTIKLYLGETAITVHPAANDTNEWRVEAEIITISLTTHKVNYIAWNGNTLVAQGQQTITADSEANITLKLTGECADGKDSITQTFWIIKRL